MFAIVPFAKRREDVFRHLTRSFDEMWSESFFAPFRTDAPVPFKTDIRETEQAYFIEAELPGFGKDDIRIEYENPYLTVKAERKAETEAREEAGRVVRRERRYGEFVRRFYAKDLDEADVKASLKNGLLRLEVPKRPKPQAKRIEIADGE